MRLIGAIETRSLFSSLAAARRGFTFYLADSARLTRIALDGSGVLPLSFCCSGRRVAYISIFEVAADTVASTGKSERLIAAVLLKLRMI